MAEIWRLKKGMDRRVRGGHPWVFSNELSESPKGLAPGTPVELRDFQNQILARGYGNPHSLIAFRALTTDPGEINPWTDEFLIERLLQAWRHRKKFGFLGSFRLCFGESDFLPGIVVDYYFTKPIANRELHAQVFSVQIVTAGLQSLIPQIDVLIKKLVERAHQEQLTNLNWDQTAVVLRNDVSVRKLEGMVVEEPKVIKTIDSVDLSNIEIAVNSAHLVSSDSDISNLIWMSCDLVHGQKTGFFLDQTFNIKIVCDLLARDRSLAGKKIRILDLCCYVGHWSTQLTHVLKSLGCEVEATLVDVSKSALAFAQKNVEKVGGVVRVENLDVMENLERLPTGHYDIVIADPPAFIKAKKDIPTGKHAYLKLNTQAFRLVKRGGLVASCSCSGLLTEEDLREAVRKAIQRHHQQHSLVRGVARGGHAVDHPTLIQFPEGFYLKMFVHCMG